MHILILAIYGIYLALLAVIDVKKRKIPLIWLLAGIVFVPIGIIDEGFETLYTHILGLIPGVLSILIAIVSRGQIGMADAVLLTVTGAFLGFGPSICVISVSLLNIAFVAGLMLMAGKLGRKSTLPYVPFLLLGYVITVVIFKTGNSG